jgi:hypothetical protein
MSELKGLWDRWDQLDLAVSKGSQAFRETRDLEDRLDLRVLLVQSVQWDQGGLQEMQAKMELKDPVVRADQRARQVQMAQLVLTVYQALEAIKV